MLFCSDVWRCQDDLKDFYRTLPNASIKWFFHEVVYSRYCVVYIYFYVIKHIIKQLYFCNGLIISQLYKVFR